MPLAPVPPMRRLSDHSRRPSSADLDLVARSQVAVAEPLVVRVGLFQAPPEAAAAQVAQLDHRAARPLRVAANGARPAVLAAVARIHQGLVAQAAIAALVAMVQRVAAAAQERWLVDAAAMPAQAM